MKKAKISKTKITIKPVITNEIEKNSTSLLDEQLEGYLNQTEELIKTSTYSELEEEWTRSWLKQIDDTIVACEQLEVDQFVLVKLKHNYYELKDIILRQQAERIEVKLKAYDNKIKTNQKNNDKYIAETKEAISNIGYNILSIIISSTIGTTLITAIDKISAVYIPLFVIGTIWLMLTLMVFVNGLFGKNDFNRKQSTFMYAIFSILTIIALIYTFYFSINHENVPPLYNDNSIETIEKD